MHSTNIVRVFWGGVICLLTIILVNWVMSELGHLKTTPAE